MKGIQVPCGERGCRDNHWRGCQVDAQSLVLCEQDEGNPRRDLGRTMVGAGNESIGLGYTSVGS